jgi:hypothetical protein
LQRAAAILLQRKTSVFDKKNVVQQHEHHFKAGVPALRN